MANRHAQMAHALGRHREKTRQDQMFAKSLTQVSTKGYMVTHQVAKAVALSCCGHWQVAFGGLLTLNRKVLALMALAGLSVNL